MAGPYVGGCQGWGLVAVVLVATVVVVGWVATAAFEVVSSTAELVAIVGWMAVVVLVDSMVGCCSGVEIW